jgi:hypothetical protein
VLQSHTATQQWQSFEIRMRRRRVERCLLRASVALEADVLEDVRTALEEVERLDPHEPTLHTLTAQLALAEARLAHSARKTPAVVAPAVAVPAGALAPVPVTLAEVPLVQPSLQGLSIEHDVDRPRGGRAAAYAIAVLLIAISGAGGWFYVTGLPPAVQPMTRPDRPAQPQTDAASAGVAPATAPAVRVNETAAAAAPSLDPAAPEAAVATAGPDRAVDASAVVATVPPPPPPGTTIDAGKPTSLRTPESPATGRSAANAPTATPPPVVERPRALEPSPSLPESPPVAPVAVAGADGVALTDTSVNLTPPPVPPPAAAAPAPPPAPAAAAPQNDERLVRAVLGRYEAAYSALDAAAASRVWPTVDRRALASAFDGLQSQTVSLGRCDVRMSGATAQAECRGTARWNPKVGAGLQSASRQWNFELRNTGGDWIIARATVR